MYISKRCSILLNDCQLHLNGSYQKMPGYAGLSGKKVKSLNRIIDHAGTMLVRRGVQEGGTARYEDGPLLIVAKAWPSGRARLAVVWHGETVLEAAWPARGGLGRLMVDQPGPWMAALLAVRVLDS